MRESLLNQLAAGPITGFSAGNQPAGRVNPHARVLLAGEGLETSSFTSKSWDVFATGDAPQMDVVITVCGSAANETCPIWPATPLRAHWAVEDPAATPENKVPAAFSTTYATLRRRVLAFLDQPVETMQSGILQAHLAACADVE